MAAPLTPKKLANILYQMQHLDDDRRPLAFGIIATCTVLSSLAVALRFASRRVAHVPFKADDFAALASWVGRLGSP